MLLALILSSSGIQPDHDADCEACHNGRQGILQQSGVFVNKSWSWATIGFQFNVYLSMRGPAA